MIPEDHAIDVEYDLIAIVDGLPQNDRDKWQLSNDLADHLAAKGLDQEIVWCNNKSDVVAGLDHFVKRAREGMKFAMHFVCHGNAEGLWLDAAEELIPWQEFAKALREMNDLMGGQLTVNMSSCQGLHGVKIVSADYDDLPFFGLVGPKKKIRIETAKRVNKMYYDLQLDGMDIEEVIQQINKDEGKELLYGISAKIYQYTQRLRKKGGRESLSF